MARRSVWVAVLNISWRTAEKISHRHQLTADEVRDAVVCVAGLTYAWDVDVERGERAIVQVHLRGRPALVVLYPTDDPIGDIWNLGSAYFTDT
ncbi:hypothetical protein GCM10009779_66010 [Polymorphospora rubra]|uniref:DUF4258 domain-containing protein n=1 Tax=Polymorphospora rubra TaxID=338584 RepID=A0A810MUZ9_9ACTN|nr:hypothetical protein Prubr_18530 [Polymorphospora rubra]